MSEYNDDNKDGNAKTQLQKFLKNDPVYPEKTKFNIFDIIGTVTGVILGMLILPFPWFLEIIIGGAAGYFLTPYFVPKIIRWIKKLNDKNKDY